MPLPGLIQPWLILLLAAPVLVALPVSNECTRVSEVICNSGRAAAQRRMGTMT